MRPYTTVKLSLRTPPTLEAEEKKKDLEEILTKNPPYNAKVEVLKTVYAKGWNSPDNQKYLDDILN